MRYTSRDLRAIDLFALMLLGIGLLFLVMGSLVLIQGGRIVVSRAPLRSKPVVKLSAAPNAKPFKTGKIPGVRVKALPNYHPLLFGVVFVCLGTALGLGVRRVQANGGEDAAARADRGNATP